MTRSPASRPEAISTWRLLRRPRRMVRRSAVVAVARNHEHPGAAGVVDEGVVGQDQARAALAQREARFGALPRAHAAGRILDEQQFDGEAAMVHLRKHAADGDRIVAPVDAGVAHGARRHAVQEELVDLGDQLHLARLVDAPDVLIGLHDLA